VRERPNPRPVAPDSSRVGEVEVAEGLYLDLLKRVLTRTGFDEPVPLFFGALPGSRQQRLSKIFGPVRQILARRGLELVHTRARDPSLRVDGRDWPSRGETMIGMKRLNNLEECVVDVLRHGVPGDLMETGVWRGGACIFMRAILRAYCDGDRAVWVADSFEGMPSPDSERFPADTDCFLNQCNDVLSVSLEQVKANFERYGLLDDQVRFLKGWFRDTLPNAPVERLAILRLDADLYESTIDALDALYPKVSPGGYVIIDDYGVLESCRSAVDHYRRKHNVDEKIQWVDGSGIYWQRS
jgi:hypothetical protein